MTRFLNSPWTRLLAVPLALVALLVGKWVGAW